MNLSILPNFGLNAELMDDIQCKFQGNSDIYGLGVRLGAYLQWMTLILSENLYEPAAPASRETNSTFQVAMMAGLLLIMTHFNRETKSIEGLLALLLCFASAGITWLEAFSNWRRRSAEGSKRSAARAGFLLLGTATCAGGVWFLFLGIDTLPRTPCPETVFFFARVPLFGWYRTVLKVVFTACLAGSALLTTIHSVSTVRGIAVALRQWRQADPPSPAQAQIFPRANLSASRFLGGIAAMALFIVTIELTLAWNSIDGVYTCTTFSQLFPLVVGVTNFVRVGVQLLHSFAAGDVRIDCGP